MIYNKQSFMNAWAERARQMAALREEGKTFSQLGEMFGVTRQRAQQIIAGMKVPKKRNGKKC